MSSESQIVVPESFIALFIEPGRIRPRIPVEEILGRYELCEDLATALTERAKTIQWELGVTETDVLERIHSGLLADASGLGPAQSWWVVQRLAELLEWPLPQLQSPHGELTD